MDPILLLKTIRDGLAGLIMGAGFIAAVQVAEAYMAGPVMHPSNAFIAFCALMMVCVTIIAVAEAYFGSLSAMTTRDKLIERVAAVLVPDMDPTDTMVQVFTEARAAAIVDALGLVEVTSELERIKMRSGGGHPDTDTIDDLLRDLRHIDASAKSALSKLRGEQS